jgi:cytidylate kinase
VVRLPRLSEQNLTRWEIDGRLAQRFWRDERDRRPRPDLITISREVGSGGSSIARLVAAELGYQLYDREVIEYIAARLRAELRHVQAVDERAPSAVEEILRGALERAPTSATYRRLLAEVMRELAARGRAVIVGRGGVCLLPQALRVRIMTPFEVRVARVAELENLDEATARRRVAELDRQRLAFGRRHFQCDLDAPALYDLVINTARTSLERAAGLIIAAAEQLAAGSPRPAES